VSEDIRGAAQGIGRLGRCRHSIGNGCCGFLNVPSGGIGHVGSHGRHELTPHTPGSSGAILFQELYAALGELNAASWWNVPFDPASPLETPRGAAHIDAALAKLEELVASSQFDSAAKRRVRPQDVQFLSRNGGPLAMPGGRYTFYNWRGVKTQVAPGNWIYTAHPATNAGAYGNSYLQFVTWDEGGPIAEGMLSYGQSSNPESVHFNDLTKLYAAGKWVKLPYTEAQITADPEYRRIEISE